MPPRSSAPAPAPLPRVLMVVPVERGPATVRGMAAKMRVGDGDGAHDVWMLTAPKAAPPATLALLLGALLVDEAEPMLKSAAMPDGAAAVVLPTAGALVAGRGRRLAPWALAEIDRVAGRLRAEHAGYLAAVTAALNGRGPLFRPTPDDFVLSDGAAFSRIGPPPPAVAVDRSQSERVRLGLAPLDVLAADYRRNRYLAGLSDAALARRTADIVANIHVVNADGRVALDPEDPAYRVWLAYLAEVGAEQQLRHGPDLATWPRGLVDRALLPGSLQPDAPARHKPLRPATPLPDAIVVRYSRRDYLEQAYHEGKLLVNPASRYGDPSLNPAQRDEELAAEIDFDPAPYAPFGSFAEWRGAPSAAAARTAAAAMPGARPVPRPSRRFAVRHELGTNYYVYCTAAALSARLLLDFQADAALVIRDPDAFFARLDAAVLRQLPGWRSLRAPVTYYDPLQVTPAEVQLVRWKHFRYAYQQEVRMAWLPPTPVTDLVPLKIELGPLTDIAELLI